MATSLKDTFAIHHALSASRFKALGGAKKIRTERLFIRSATGQKILRLTAREAGTGVTPIETKRLNGKELGASQSKSFLRFCD